jgi:predicted HAD superfamily phosphohydrolase YqeG
MLHEANPQLMAIINDLDALIVEIDNNPSLSPWVIRLILKSMKDKAKKMAIDTSQSQYLEKILILDAFSN